MSVSFDGECPVCKRSMASNNSFCSVRCFKQSIGANLDVSVLSLLNKSTEGISYE